MKFFTVLMLVCSLGLITGTARAQEARLAMGAESRNVLLTDAQTDDADANQGFTISNASASAISVSTDGNCAWWRVRARSLSARWKSSTESTDSCNSGRGGS